jgi:hypothetical protein
MSLNRDLTSRVTTTSSVAWFSERSSADMARVPEPDRGGMTLIAACECVARVES